MSSPRAAFLICDRSSPPLRWRRRFRTLLIGGARRASGTQVLHRVALGRVLPILGASRIDEITVDDVNRLVAELATTRKRETIRKSVKYSAAVLEDAEINPNSFKDLLRPSSARREVELELPEDGHVEAVLSPPAHRVPSAVPLGRLVRCPGRIDRPHPCRRLRRTRTPRKATRGHNKDPSWPCGSICLTSLRMHSRRRCRRVRIAIWTRLYFPAAAPIGYAPRSPVHAKRPVSPSSLRTTFATAESVSCTARAGRGLRSDASSGSGSSRSPRTHTRTFSVTAARPTTRRCSLGNSQSGTGSAYPRAYPRDQKSRLAGVGVRVQAGPLKSALKIASRPRTGRQTRNRSSPVPEPGCSRSGRP